MGLTHGTVMRIIQEDLQMTKVSARWVPKMLDDSKKEIRMTCSEEMLKDTTLIRIFWRSWSLWMRHGSPCSIPKQKGSQNNGNIPRKNSELVRLQRKFSIQFSGTRRALFSHILSQRPWPSLENVTETFLRISCCLQLQKSDLNWWGTSRQRSTTQGSHCHRIPGGTRNWDTSTSSLFTWPCSERFLVFDILKLSLRGRQFPSRSSLGSAVYQSLKHIPKDSYKKCYEKWVGRWQLCLDKEGDCVEK